jgi:hypothetical protein
LQNFKRHAGGWRARNTDG